VQQACLFQRQLPHVAERAIGLGLPVGEALVLRHLLNLGGIQAAQLPAVGFENPLHK
jgi:hypothetical protein